MNKKNLESNTACMHSKRKLNEKQASAFNNALATGLEQGVEIIHQVRFKLIVEINVKITQRNGLSSDN